MFFWAALVCSFQRIQVAIRAKLEKEKTERKKVREAAKAAENGEVAQERKPSALDRFRRSG